MARFCGQERGHIGVAEKVSALETKNLPFTHLALGQLVNFSENPFPQQKTRITLILQNWVAAKIKRKNVFN